MDAALQKDQGLTDEGRAAIVAAIHERFHDYANRVVKPDGADLSVVLRMIAEGTFDNVSPERIAEVAFAAFVAVGRGAQPEIVEGIGLYGYRKQIPGDRIAVWANGFNDTAKGGVPAEVGADLVANAMEHDWDDSTFNTFKWSLVDAQKRKFDIRRYAAFLFQRMEQGRQRPGAITLTAVNTFRQAQQRGQEVPIADYHGVFSIPKETPAPPPPPPPAEAAQPAEPEGEPAQQAEPSAEQAAARQAEAKADDDAKEQEAAAAKAQEDARSEREQAEAAAATAADERKAAEAQEREARAQQAAAEKARAQADADADRQAQEQAAAEASKARKAAREAKKKALADGKAAEKLRKKAELDRKAAEKATKKATKARAAADKARQDREALGTPVAASTPPASTAAADTSGADAESGEATADHPPGSPPKFSDAKMAAVWPDLNAAAHTYLGVPYVWGGETKKGIDCSGFTKNSYREGAKVGIPRNSRMQWKTGQRVDFDKLQAGDLVFFDTMGHGVSHVGMVIDPASNTFMHASSSRGVMEADLSKQWFRKRYLGARRVIQ